MKKMLVKIRDLAEEKLRAADTKQALEDLYLPYRPKRRTKAMIAREAGRRVRLSTQLVYVAGEMPRGMTRSRTREEI